VCGQVVAEEADGGGVGVEAVDPLGQTMTLVGIHPELARNAFAVEGRLDLLGLGQRGPAGHWHRA